MSLSDLGTIEDKYLGSPDPEIILNDEMGAIPRAILETFEILRSPCLVYVDATMVRVEALADSPARVMMCGIPNILNPGTFITGGLTDGRYRTNVVNVNMDFDNAGDKWGNEKASQWYALFAIAEYARYHFCPQGHALLPG